MAIAARDPLDALVRDLDALDGPSRWFLSPRRGLYQSPANQDPFNDYALVTLPPEEEDDPEPPTLDRVRAAGEHPIVVPDYLYQRLAPGLEPELERLRVEQYEAPAARREFMKGVGPQGSWQHFITPEQEEDIGAHRAQEYRTGKVPSLQTGGVVPRTDLYRLHKGEVVLPARGEQLPTQNLDVLVRELDALDAPRRGPAQNLDALVRDLDALDVPKPAARRPIITAEPSRLRRPVPAPVPITEEAPAEPRAPLLPLVPPTLVPPAVLSVPEEPEEPPGTPVPLPTAPVQAAVQGIRESAIGTTARLALRAAGAPPPPVEPVVDPNVVDQTITGLAGIITDLPLIVLGGGAAGAAAKSTVKWGIEQLTKGALAEPGTYLSASKALIRGVRAFVGASQGAGALGLQAAIKGGVTEAMRQAEQPEAAAAAAAEPARPLPPIPATADLKYLHALTREIVAKDYPGVPAHQLRGDQDAVDDIDRKLRQRFWGPPLKPGAVGAAEVGEAEGAKPGFDVRRIITAAIKEGAKGAAVGGLTFGLSSQVPPGVLKVLTEAAVFGTAGPLVHEGRAPTIQDLVESGVQIGVIAGAFRLAGIRPPRALSEIVEAGTPEAAAAARAARVGVGETEAARRARGRPTPPVVPPAPPEAPGAPGPPGAPPAAIIPPPPAPAARPAPAGPAPGAEIAPPAAAAPAVERLVEQLDALDHTPPTAPPEAWLIGRTQALERQGLNPRDAIHQAVLDWQGQERLATVAAAPVATVPERPETLARQLEALERGDKPAVLLPPDTPAPALAEGLASLDTDKGLLVYRPEAVAEAARDLPGDTLPDKLRWAVDNDQEGLVLGYGVAAKPAPGEPITLVEARGPADEEVQTVVAPSPTPPEVVESAERVASEGGEVVLTPPEEAEGRAAEVVRDRLRRSQPPVFSEKLYQGRGATPEQVYGEANVKAGRGHPLVGPGNYYTFTKQDAERYGKVTEQQVELRNPYVLTSNRQWFDLLKAAKAEQLSSVDPEQGPSGPAAQRLQDYLVAQGHDGFVVRFPPASEGDVGETGQSIKRVRESFGESQVVVFGPVPKAEARAAEVVAGRVMRGRGRQAALLPVETDEMIGEISRFLSRLDTAEEVTAEHLAEAEQLRDRARQVEDPGETQVLAPGLVRESPLAQAINALSREIDRGVGPHFKIVERRPGMFYVESRQLGGRGASGPFTDRRLAEERLAEELEGQFAAPTPAPPSGAPPRQGALVPVTPEESNRLVERVDSFLAGETLKALEGDIADFQQYGTRLDIETIDENAPARQEAERLRGLIDEHLDGQTDAVLRQHLEGQRAELEGVIGALTPAGAQPPRVVPAAPPARPALEPPAPAPPAAPVTLNSLKAMKPGQQVKVAGEWWSKTFDKYIPWVNMAGIRHTSAELIAMEAPGRLRREPAVPTAVPKIGDRVVVMGGQHVGEAGRVERFTAGGNVWVRLDEGPSTILPPAAIHVTAARGRIQPSEEGGERGGRVPARQPGAPDQGPLEGAPPEDVAGAGAGGEAGGGRLRRPGAHERPDVRPAGEPGAPLRPGRGVGQAGVGVPAERAGAAEPELRPGEPEREPPRAGAAREPERTPARDYRITDPGIIGQGSPREKARGNLEAIRLLKKLEEAGRPATPEEQAVLVKYVGWGGMPQPFDAYNVPRDWQGVRADLDSLLTPEEFASARASTPNAHYTSPLVVEGMWRAMERLGLPPGALVLEPAVGIGHFFGLMPEALSAEAKRTGVELDSISGRIAKLLYPEASVRIAGFEQTRLPDDFFDLAISNVPFGNYGVHDPRYRKTPFLLRSIHDYFFAKALDKVRPGGVVAFITSSYTMDKVDPAVRRYLAERADLLGAIRLPNTAFKATAGTEVTTDILFLLKRAPQTEATGEAWAGLTEITGKDGATIRVNEYYARHPEMMLGQMALEGTMYATKSPTLVGDLTRGQIEAAVARLPAGAMTPREAAPLAAGVTMAGESAVAEGAFTVQEDGTLSVRRGSFFEPAQLTPGEVLRVKGMLAVRDTTRQALTTQRTGASEAEIVEARQALNAAYDTFVRRHGFLWARDNMRLFDGDPDAPLLLALEEWDAETRRATKAPIFTTRIQEPYRPPASADTADEAMMFSLNELGRLDWSRMQDLTGKTPAELQSLLGALVYRNPAGGLWETADAYLSGNVREKLATAEAAAASDRTYARNVEALKAVQPEDLLPSDISAEIGAPWIPAQEIKAFMQETLALREAWFDVVYVEHTSTWVVDIAYSDRVERSTANAETWGTARYFGTQLVDDALNLRTPTVYDTIRDSMGERRVLNEAETLAARDRVDKLKAEFRRWVWADADRAQRLARTYNDRVNNLRLRLFDGAHLTFPGMSKVTLRRQDLDPHQKTAVYRVLQEGKAILAHAVGSGKTFEIVAAATELRRLGLARKVMIVVKNATLGQWQPAFQRLYPGSKALVISSADLGKGRRERVLAKIATGLYDAIVIPHSTFWRIPVSDALFTEFLNRELLELETYLTEARQRATDPKRDPTVKELEKAKKRLEAKLERRAKREQKDKAGLTWEELGIDFLFVDESQAFKALFFPTKMQRVSGLSTSESDRAFDMYIKTQELLRRNRDRGVVFATATPLTNTIAEVFNLQRYLQPDLLEAAGLTHFDAWARVFGRAVTSWEIAPATNKMRKHTRFIQFDNAPELMRQVRLVMDVQTAAMLDLPRPTLEGGKRIDVIAKSTPELHAYIQTLIHRMEAFKHRYDPRVDNPLKVSTDGRKAALDLRLVVPGAKDNPTGKVNLAVQHIYDEWARGAKARLTQLVFLDLSKPADKGSRAFSVYDDIKAKLVRRGVPEKEIAFIYDADTDEQLMPLFQRVNKGQVRILLGSSEKMGVGVNVQARAVALHHLDAPWRPDQIEQREGRILRQGNTNATVRIYRYGTENSFDAYVWQLLQGKAAMIEEFMRGDFSRRSIEDVNTVVLTYEEMKALTTGNPLVIEKVKVDAEVRRLEGLRYAHENQQQKVANEIRGLPPEIAEHEKTAADLRTDVATREAHAGEFTMTILGTAYGGKGARDGAAKALAKAIDTQRGALSEEEKRKPAVNVGTLRGFTVEVVPQGKGWTPLVYLRGARRYIVTVNEENPLGTVESMESTLRNLEKRLERQADEATQKRARLKGLETQRGAAFEHTDKLRALIERQQEIDTALGEKKDQGGLAEDVPEEPEEEALRIEEAADVPEVDEPPEAPTSADEVSRENLREVREQKRREEAAGRTTTGILAGPIGLLFRRRGGRAAAPPGGPPAPPPTAVAAPGGAPAPRDLRFRGHEGAPQGDIERALTSTAAGGLPGLGERLVGAYQAIRRATTFEWDLREYPLERDEVRVFQAERRRAFTRAGEDVVGIAGRLVNRSELEHFTRVVLLRDYQARILDPDRFPGGVPEGLTFPQIEAELQRLEGSAPDRVRAALEAHARLMGAERADLEERGLLDPDRAIADYFPHFVLDFEGQGPELPRTRRIKRPFRRFLQRARGSAKLVETDYIRALFRHRAEVRFANAVDDFALKILNRHDKADTLPKDVRRHLRPGQLIEIDGVEHKVTQYRPGRSVFPARTIAEEAVAAAIANHETTLEINLEDVGRAGALGRYYKLYLVPREIAERFEHFAPEAVADGWRQLNEATSRWKAVTIGFWGQAGNVLNLMGDVMNLARTPGGLLHLPRAAVEVAKWQRGTGSDLARLMEDYDVLSSGFVANETYFRAKAPELRQFLTRGQAMKERALDVVRFYFRTIPTYREAVPRAAMALFQLRRLRRGKPLRPGPLDIRGLEGTERAAMKLAREFTVDYGKFTDFENRMLRGFLLPFYSWVRQNTPNWLRFLWLSRLGLTAFLGLRLIMELWNNADDERQAVERSLPGYKRNAAHIVTGWRDENDKMIVVYFVGDPMADALGMVGLAGTPGRLSDLATGHITLDEAARQQLLALVNEPGQRVGGLLTPVVKVPIEWLTGKSALTGGDISPREFRGTSEERRRMRRHIGESFFRPLREERMLRIQAGKKEGLDVLTHRFGLGLPFERKDVGEAQERVLLDRWYEAMNQAAEQAIAETRDGPDFAQNPPHVQELDLREAAEKARREFMKDNPVPVSRAERRQRLRER